MQRVYLRHVVALALCAGPAVAQPSPPPMPPPSAAAPSPEALKLARILTEKSGGGGIETMSGLSLPMARVLHELKVGPVHANTIVQEAILPTLSVHKEELTAIQTQSYATNLSIDDMKAAIAFYESAAGQDLVRTHSRVLMANMAGVSNLFETIMPDFEKQTDAVLKQHGWTKITPPMADPASLGGPRTPK
jgi:hypothetical protein